MDQNIINLRKEIVSLSFAIYELRQSSEILSFIDRNPEAAKEWTAMEGGHPLHEACSVDHSDNSSYGYDNVIMKLIEVFPDATGVTNRMDDYPLHLALANCQIEAVIIKLIEVFPNATQIKNSKGLYPLHQAVRSSQSEAVIMKLIEVFPNAARQRKYTRGLYPYPLHLALLDCQAEAVIMKLIEVFPNAARKNIITGRNSYPLHLALSSCVPEVVIMKLLEVFPKAVQVKNEKGQYPLHLACNMYKNVSAVVIMKLLEMFPEAAKEKDNANQYPLHLACHISYHHYGIRSIKFIQKILESYPLALQEKETEYGMYPIHLAMYEDVIQLFVTTDPSVLQQREKYGKTPFHYACYKDNVFHFEYLVDLPGVDINTQDDEGKTPLYHAMDNMEVFEVLLQKEGIRVNEIIDHGKTVLHYACERKHPCFVEKLLEHPGIIIDMKDQYNQTPLDIVNKRLEKDWISEQEMKTLLRKKHLLEEFPIKRKWQAFQYIWNPDQDCAESKNKKIRL